MTEIVSFKAILFDVDDTLFNRRTAFNKWAEHYFVNILQIESARKRLTMHDEINAIDGSGYGSKKELIETLLVLYPPSKESSYSAAAAYEEYVDETKLDSDATGLLDYLDSLCISYGIVTNGTMRQVDKVERLGLRPRTGCIFVSATFGFAKPEPQIFLAAAHCLGYSPRQILFAGDHPVNDILGAHNVGMSTAWIRNGQQWPEELKTLVPSVAIDNLSDLISIIEAKGDLA